MFLAQINAAPAAEPDAQFAWDGRTFEQHRAQLSHDDAQERARALQALDAMAKWYTSPLHNNSTGRHAFDPAPAIDAARKALADHDPDVRCAAANALATLAAHLPQDKALFEVVTRTATGDPDPSVRAVAAAACVALIQDNPHALAFGCADALKRAANDPETIVRRHLARALSDHDLPRGTLSACLPPLVKDSDPVALQRTLRTVVSRGKDMTDLRPLLIDALTTKGHPNPGLVLQALKQVGWENETCLPALAKALELHGDGFIDPAFQRIVEGGKAGVPICMNSLGNEKRRYAAVEALGRIGAPEASEAVPALKEALEALPEHLKFQAKIAIALTTLDPEDVRPYVESEDARDHYNVLEYLARRRFIPETFIPLMVEAYERDDRDLERWHLKIVQILGIVGPPAAPALVAMLDDDQRALHDAFAAALSNAGSAAHKATPFVNKRIQESKDAHARQKWQAVLVAISTDAQQAAILESENDDLKALLLQHGQRTKVPFGPLLTKALWANYPKASARTMGLWANVLVQHATNDQLLGFLDPATHELLMQQAVMELGRRGGKAAGVLDKLKAKRARTREELESLRARNQQLSRADASLETAIRRIETLLEQEKKGQEPVPPEKKVAP